MNKLIISGNVGSVKDITYTQSGKAVMNFTVAVNKRTKDAEGNKLETTLWVDCAVWGVQAETAHTHNLITKGKFIIVTGEASLESYENREGVTVPKLCIKFVDSYEVNGGSKESEDGTPPARRPDAPKPPARGEDIPF